MQDPAFIKWLSQQNLPQDPELDQWILDLFYSAFMAGKQSK